MCWGIESVNGGPPEGNYVQLGGLWWCCDAEMWSMSRNEACGGTDWM